MERWIEDTEGKTMRKLLERLEGQATPDDDASYILQLYKDRMDNGEDGDLESLVHSFGDENGLSNREKDDLIDLVIRMAEGQGLKVR